MREAPLRGSLRGARSRCDPPQVRGGACDGSQKIVCRRYTVVGDQDVEIRATPTYADEDRLAMAGPIRGKRSRVARRGRGLQSTPATALLLMSPELTTLFSDRTGLPALIWKLKG